MRMRTALAPLGAMTLLAGLAFQAGAEPRNTVIMQGLDKVTARVSTFEAAIDQPVSFGALTITPRHCDRTPPEEAPESAAFLEIWEQKRGDEEALSLFNGWMFASSPALSALEHPVYDVWVLECVDREAGTAAPAEETNEQ
ncbi:DUF2155 domain-containing protein [Aestuariispira insulae]